MPLFPDVALDDVPGAPLRDGGDVVPVRPELTAPEFTFEVGVTPEELSRGDAFVEPDDLPGGILGVC